MKLDLKFIFEQSHLESNIILIIDPLAPLSMVSSMPGGHYKTLREPTHAMLTGLFENILDLHLSINDRKFIRKKIESNLNKLKKKEGLKFHFLETNSTFLPILSHLFTVDLIIQPSVNYFNDLWKRLYRRSDAIVHPKGTPNLDYKLLIKKRQLPLDDKEKIVEKEYENLFKRNIGGFPLYYSTLSDREYIRVDGEYKFKIRMNDKLYQLLCEKLKENDLGYLGTSDGWVSLKLEKL
ncbi:MAG: type I-PGING CRISPR-associated protein Cas5p [Spirosomataceae bacterium]